MHMPFGKHSDLSVKAKISLGFFVVLMLHVSVAILSYYGQQKAKQDLTEFDSRRLQVELYSQIDQDVGALQRNVLLFAFTGYDSAQERVAELQTELETLLNEAIEQESGTDHHTLKRMQQHLTSHKEIFENVVIDREKRRHLVTEVMAAHSEQFEDQLQKMGFLSPHTVPVDALSLAFRTAQQHMQQFIITLDSSHIVRGKQQLKKAHRIVTASLERESEVHQQILFQVDLVLTDYEVASNEMVQATRGYLHLVNVVLAGESVEFRRLATTSSQQQSEQIQLLAMQMKQDTQKFQSFSNLVSAITIVLGVLAAWVIGRDVAPALHGITETFIKLSEGETCEAIPGLTRKDELGHLAGAAQVFKDKASQTEELLEQAKQAKAQMDQLNSDLQLQRQIAEQMAQEANAATLAKSEFLANMSHEIRTPMTAILGFTEALEETVSDEQALDAIQTIHRNGHHLLSIINDILDLSKVEAGQMEIEQVLCHPANIVEEVIELMHVKAESAGLRIESRYLGLLPDQIQADPTRLRQILINLIGNAIKFTQEGGITIEVSFLKGTHNQLQIDVVDTGIGMTQEQINRLFLPFSQADSSTTRKYGGTGLGLSVSKRLAERMEGDLQVQESHPDQGTRFRLTVGIEIPRNVSMYKIKTKQGTQPEQSQAPAEDLSGMNVLLVEDGIDNQALISMFLRKAKASVELRENGLLGYEKATEQWQNNEPFDCILMDMQMPVMSGYEATAKLRADGYTGAIIAVTAHAMEGDRQKCLDAGCDDYLTKPLNRKLMVQKVLQQVAAKSENLQQS